MSDKPAATTEGTPRQWRNLTLLALAELLGLTLWFSSSAVTPAIKADWGLSAGAVAWLVMAVQIGFVVGTFLSGVLNLPDVISARKLFAILDEDNSGAIDKKEMVHALRHNKEAAALAQPTYVKPKGPGRGRRRKPKNAFAKKP